MSYVLHYILRFSDFVKITHHLQKINGSMTDLPGMLHICINAKIIFEKRLDRMAVLS